MACMSRTSTPGPERIVDTLTAYWRTEILRGAIDIDLFTALGDGPRTVSELTARCRTSAVGMRKLCDYLVALGFVRRRAGRYRSAPDAARFLDRRSPDVLVDITPFYASAPVADGFATVGAAVRRGGTTLARRRLTAPRSAVWARFARSVWTLRRLHAEPIADELIARGHARGRALDLGCGGSPLGITLLERRPALRIVAQDWPNVVPVAAEQARRAGVGDRLSTLPGDARTVDLGGPYDLVLLANVLDYFDAETRLALLRRVRAVLRPGGVAAIAAPLLDDGRTSPPDAVAYSMLLFVTSPTGDASTFGELDVLLRSAGFTTTVRCDDVSLVLSRVPRKTRALIFEQHRNTVQRTDES